MNGHHLSVNYQPIRVEQMNWES